MEFFFLKSFVALLYIHSRIHEVYCAGNEYNPKRSYNFPTHWPINVDSDTVKPVKTGTPLLLTVGLIEEALVENTGKSAIIKLNQERTSDTISGGVLGPDTYIYKYCRFYWVNDTTRGRAASTINHHGRPMEVALYYYNKRYGNFSEALLHRDGLVVFSLPIRLGVIANPFFVLFQKYLVQVKKAHNEVPAILSLTYLWFAIFLAERYYAYAGSYRDEASSTEYFCATILLHPDVLLPFIDEKQFQTFLDLRDDKGQPLTNQAPLYSNNGQPVVEATGVAVLPFPL